MFLEREWTNSAAQRQLTASLLVNNALLHQEGCSYSAHTEWQYCISYNCRHVQWTQKCRRNIFSSLHVQPVALGSIWCDAAPQLVFDWSAGCASEPNTLHALQRGCLGKQALLLLTEDMHKKKSLFFEEETVVLRTAVSYRCCHHGKESINVAEFNLGCTVPLIAGGRDFTWHLQMAWIMGHREILSFVWSKLGIVLELPGIQVPFFWVLSGREEAFRRQSQYSLHVELNWFRSRNMDAWKCFQVSHRRSSKKNHPKPTRTSLKGTIEIMCFQK